MPSPLAVRRHQILSAARADPPGFARIDPESVRFRLGTSLADFAIPVLVAPDAAAILRDAAGEIALLLGTHHRFVPGDDRDRLVVREAYARLPAVDGALGPCAGGPDLRAAARLGPEVHPALTGGIVTAWMGRGGSGNALAALLIALWRRAFREMAASGGREPTPLVVALAVSGELQSLDRGLRDLLPAPPLDTYLRGAAMGALWVAARTALARAWRDAGRAQDDPLLPRIEAALAPGQLLGGRAAVVASGATLYGCDLSAGIPRADELTARLAAGGDPDAVAGDLAVALGADEDVARRAEGAVAVARLREALTRAVLRAEAARQPVPPALATQLVGPGALAAAVADEAGRKGLLGLLSAAGFGGEAGEAAEGAVEALRRWKGREAAVAVGLGREEARGEYAAAAAALLCDVALERHVSAARGVLSARTGREEERGGDAEWEAGRLYRLTSRGGPIRQDGLEHDVGHLFADIKDFTRRTSIVGQAAVADLLRREFYVPILDLAKRHFGGMTHLSDGGGVTINNLIGDAVSFSGGTAALVAMACDVRCHFAAYAARLRREISREAQARRIEAIEREHAGPVAAAARARAVAQAAVAAAPAGSHALGLAQYRLARAVEEEERVAAEREKALARARGEAIEAGIFVSYGPAPLVVAIDDEVFGSQRVAIADKINESARGTARVPSARARWDAELEAERGADAGARREHAWRVFVGQPLSVPIPPEPEAAALRAFAGGDPQMAMRHLAGPVRVALEAAASADADAPGDVYNAGIALSADALQAWLAEVGGGRVVRRLDLPPAEVPPDLRQRWFYGRETLNLVACFLPDGRPAELYRRVGRAAFKGLGDVVVWELCDDQGGGGALHRHFGPRWLRDAGR